MGSPGLAARDLRECLLLQLDQLERLGPSQPLVRQLLAEHLEGLARGGAGQLASVLGVSVEEVQSAREFIRTQLRPLGSPAELEPWARPACGPRLVPDVAISFADVQPLSIEVEVLSPVALRVAPLYRQVAAAAADQHVVDSVRRAESFLLLLDRRAETLRNIVQRAASAQVSLLLHGRPAPRPPTRAEVASELGLHGSTVSRAVANKVAVLPGHRLMPLSGFFEIRPAVEDALRQLIGAEEQPLSDGQLAARLTSLGYRVARRTVAKYRDRLCLPVATARS
jgi:RNA polymerase sigma-54 factor